MADDGPTIPSTENWSEWTFEQALKALTNEGADLHTPAKATWLKVNPSPGAGDQLQYHAWSKYYYGVNVDNDAINAWVKAIDTIDEMMPDVAWGKRGSMDSWTLTALSYAINDFTSWSQLTGGSFDQWASRLDSDDSSFKGKAAFLIQWRLKVEGDGLEDTYEQLYSRHGGPIASAVLDAANELSRFNRQMSVSWSNFSSVDARNYVRDQIVSVTNDIHAYLVASGLIKGEGNYDLQSYAESSGSMTLGTYVPGSPEKAEGHIRDVLRNYHLGDLTSAATWQSINDKITENLLTLLKGWLDQPAQSAIARLAPKYVLATNSLIEITAPPPKTAPKPDTKPPDGGDGDDNKDLPPPPEGDDKKDLPPPPDGGDGDNKDLPPPPDGGDGSGGLDLGNGGGGGGGGLDLGNPPPNGGDGSGGLDLGNGGDGSGGLDLGDPGGVDANGGGGPGGVDLANGGGGLDGLNSPDGGGGIPANGGAGGFIPGLIPPGGGTDGNGGTSGKNGIGPGSDGAFDENGLGNDLLKPPPPDGGDGLSLLPSGADQSDTHIPPGGANGDLPGGLLGKLPSGAGGDGGLGTGPGGFGSDPGKGFGSGLLATNGGAGNLPGGLGGTGPGGLGGGTGNDWLTGLPGQLSGGSPGGAPGGNGAPGSSGDGSGVPFFPPMMGGGGAGGGGEKPQERERQTWLSEDEEIWGTRVGVRSGAIGRLDDEVDEVEEFPLVGPSRRQRRADTPRRPRPDEKRNAEREATSGEEVTGSV